MLIPTRLLHRPRPAVMVAILIGAGGGLLVQAGGVSAESGPSLHAFPDPVIFPREALHHISEPGDGIEIDNFGTAGVSVLGDQISGSTPQDFQIVPLIVGGGIGTCALQVTYLKPGSACDMFVAFRPVSVWSKPEGTLVLTPSNLRIPLIGAVPWALRLTSYPQNSTGTPVIVTATANDGSPAGLVVNVFVNGTFKTACKSTCQVSLPATTPAGNTYHVAADVGLVGARPGSKGTAITRRRTVVARVTRPNCTSASCT